MRPNQRHALRCASTPWPTAVVAAVPARAPGRWARRLAALAISLAAAGAMAAQLRNDAFTLSPARPSFGAQATVAAADARQGLRVEVLSNVPGQPLTVSATNPLGRVRSASGSGRVTLLVPSDDMVNRPGYPLSFRFEVRTTSGFAPGVATASGQLVVWSGADVKPAPLPQAVVPRERAPLQPRAIDPNASPRLNTLPPSKP